MRGKHVMAGLVTLALVGAVGWWLGQRQASEAPATGDDYDYAAAFESLAPGSNAPLFRIADVAGKREDEVAAVLGAPWTCEASRYSRRCQYAPGATEIVYIDGRADWLTVNALGESALDDALLMRIGLKPAKPTSSSDGERLWTDVGGLREVRAVGTPDSAQFLRIKVKS